MVRETSTALEAWETLREFFVKQNLHNRAQLRKKLHDFSMSAGGNLMDHLLEFDDLCLRLAAVGDKVDDDERLIILLGSLPHEYDAMVKIIEARDTTTLFEAKEMLRREYEALAQQDKEEAAFNVRGFRGERSRGDLNGARNQSSRRAAGNRNQRGQWRRRQNGQSHGPMNGIFQDVASDRAQAVELPS
ncbi:putative polyprotein [Phytophthora cinnamomi]|uniref:putative polyprotein n=1 Tax=Phytophthora cinnamomi TaxID=4785 RepID=UPI003559EC5D|nr:putative polyprotein [Phytophthora cinnamomi]